MSILTASNPLILALVLSLYHVSKESYRILKLKKILICSTIGVFTLLILFRVLQHSEDKREFVKSLINDVVKKVMGVCRDLENLKAPVQCDLIHL